jgi:hypothetical protein
MDIRMRTLLLWCLQTCLFFYVDKFNACDVEKVKTEHVEVEDKEFKEDKKALVPSRLDHSMLYYCHTRPYLDISA